MVANVDSNVLLTITPRAYKERHVTTTLSLISIRRLWFTVYRETLTKGSLTNFTKQS